MLFNEYCDFVTKLASSYSMESYKSKLNTAALGLCGEIGEITDIAKKVVYHGMPFGEDVRDKLIKEIGDASWYFAFACRNVLNQSFKEVTDFESPEEMQRWHCSTDDKPGYLNRKLIRTSLWLNTHAADIAKIILRDYTIVDKLNEDDEVSVVTALREIFYHLTYLCKNVLSIDITEVIQRNVEKLSDRYKSLQFTTEEFMVKEAAKKD